MDKMTPKQKRFCEEYLVDLNATQAAIRAGYSKKTAKVKGCQLLTKVNIDKYIRAQLENRSTRTQIAQDDVLSELGKIAFNDLGEMLTEDGRLKNLNDMSESSRCAISGIENSEEFEGKGVDREHTGTLRKIKTWDKLKALELLGKHLGMFVDKQEMSGEVTIQIVKPERDHVNDYA